MTLNYLIMKAKITQFKIDSLKLQAEYKPIEDLQSNVLKLQDELDEIIGEICRYDSPRDLVLSDIFKSDYEIKKPI